MNLYTIFYTVREVTSKKETHRFFQFFCKNDEAALRYANNDLRKAITRDIAGRRKAEWICSVPTTEYKMGSLPDVAVGWASMSDAAWDACAWNPANMN